MTRKQFVEEYRKRLAGRYPWTTNKARFESYMQNVEYTIGLRLYPGVLVDLTGCAVVAQETWIAIGGRGKLSVAKLEKLPLE